MRMPRGYACAPQLSRPALRLLALFLVSACGGQTCGACDEERAVARLRWTRGPVKRDWAESKNEWSPASPDALFGIGDAVRTAPGGRAELELEGGARMRMKPETTVRFSESKPGSKRAQLRVATGEARIHAAKKRYELQTLLGTAVLEHGSKVRLQAREQGGVRYAVEVGKASFDTPEGRVDVEAGDELAVDIGGAVVEPTGSRDASVKDASTQGARDAGVPLDAGSDAAPDADAGSSEIVAQVEGRPARVRRPEADGWDRLGRGETTLGAGTRVRVARGGEVALQRGEAHARLEGRGEHVMGGAGEPMVRTIRGRTTAVSGQRDLVIEVPQGRIMLRKQDGGDSAASLGVDRRGSRVEAKRGRVEVRSGDRRETLRAGETANLAREGDMDVAGRGPEKAHFTVPAGENFTVRIAQPPADVGFLLQDECEHAGLVELARGGARRTASRGKTTANVRVPRGTWRYRVRCIDPQTGVRSEVATDGRIRVMRDRGRARLPRSAPLTVVDTDGRSYKVLYQNLLPEIRVRWPNAPHADAYIVHVVRAHGSNRTHRTSEPHYTFASGELPEGRYEIHFRVADRPETRSPASPVTIAFDNAASTASVRKPRDRSFEAGERVRVYGIALEGWNVRAAGKELTLDSHDRFSGRVNVPADQKGLAIRLSHPGHGIQYYVRRTRESTS